MIAVNAIDLWKKFGKRYVVKRLRFKVEEGEIYGLVGPNGAGKTTTLRILATILKPDKGDAYIFEKSVVKDTKIVRKIISYLPEDVGVYKHLTGREFLKINGLIQGLRDRDLKEAIEYGVEISGLGEFIDAPMGSYSKGMRRRIMVARALMSKSRVLILDEPTSGLDVEHAVYVRRLIKDYVKQMNASCIMSSHNMLEVEYMCDRVALMKDGAIIVEGDPKQIKGEYNAENLEEVFIKVVRK
jgi:ABC-2 type transport system ATP-binding protein